MILAIRRGVRGQGCDDLYIDELSHTDPTFIERVCLPIARRGVACVLSISSPSDKDNFATQMSLIVQENGEPVVDTVTVTEACETCKILGESKPCDHKVDESVAHLSDYKASMLRLMMSQQNYEQEMLGRAGQGSVKKAFHKDDIAHIFESQSTNIDDLHRDGGRILILVDPSGASGNGGSKTAVTSIGTFKSIADHQPVHVVRLRIACHFTANVNREHSNRCDGTTAFDRNVLKMQGDVSSPARGQATCKRYMNSARSCCERASLQIDSASGRLNAKSEKTTKNSIIRGACS